VDVRSELDGRLHRGGDGRAPADEMRHATTMADTVRIDFFFFSSRRRHTRSVSAFLLNALPIYTLSLHADCYQYFCVPEYGTANGRLRSEERRVGKECRSRWSRDHEKKKQEAEVSRHGDHIPRPGRHAVYGRHDGDWTAPHLS